jgi:hypothetical protein
MGNRFALFINRAIAKLQQKGKTRRKRKAGRVAVRKALRKALTGARSFSP